MIFRFLVLAALLLPTTAFAEAINPFGSAFSCKITVDNTATRLVCPASYFGQNRPGAARRSVLLSIDREIEDVVYCGGPNLCEDAACASPAGAPISPGYSVRFDGVDRAVYCTIGGPAAASITVRVTETFADSASASGDMSVFVGDRIVYLHDGEGNAITSRTDDGRQDLHVHDTATAAAVAALGQSQQECILNPDPTTHIRRTTNGAFDIDPGEYGCFALGETVNFALGATAAADVGVPYVPGSQQDNCRISVDGAAAVEHSVYRGTVGIFVIVPCL